MANGNFIVQNGLQVGGYTVFAGNGDIITSGNITTTGSGSIASANGFGGLNADKIYSGSSNVHVTASSVFANISGTNVTEITSSGLSVAGTVTVGESLIGASTINTGTLTAGTGNLTYVNVGNDASVGAALTVGTNLTVGGNLIVNGTTTTINSTTLTVDDLNIVLASGAGSAAAANGAGLTVDGANATILYADSSDSWVFNKTIRPTSGITSAGVIDITNSTQSTSPTTGALKVTGGVGISGNLSVGGNINITGNVTTVTFSGNSGSFIGNTTTGYGALYAGIPSGYAVLPSTPFQIATNDNTYSQLNQQNINNGQYASSDYVATADNGTDSTYYADFGISSSTFSWPELGLTAVGPNDTYLLGVGYSATGPYTGNVGNVIISSSNGRLKFASGGANIANVVAEVAGTQMKILSTTSSTSTTSGALTVAGGVGIAGAAFVGDRTTTAGVTTSSTILASTNNTIDIGASGTTFATVYATTFSGVSTTAKYADLAENYQGDSNYQPGQVLMFGGPKEVTLASADTKAVAGVVSTNPAHLMNGALTGSGVVAIALQGRVPCNVVGPIAKGDLLVSAGFGYAKANNDAQVGQVIGKALADFTGAKGQIEVVVGRV